MLAALHSSERELCLQGLVPGRACAIHMRPLGVMVSTRLFGPLPALFLGTVLVPGSVPFSRRPCLCGGSVASHYSRRVNR